MTHDEVAELLGAYALDAVDDDERTAIEDHLRDCPRCRSEVGSHREVAAHLAYVGAPAPAGVWGRIASELGAPAPEPGLPRLYARRRRWVAPALGIAAAVVAVAVGGLGWQLHDEQRKVAALQVAAGQTQLQQVMTRVSLDPASTRVTLASTDHRVKVDVVVGTDGTGYLVSNGTLAPLPGNQTYQLWATTGDRTVSLGILGSHPGIVAFPDPITDMTAMALTAERSGGVVQTTNVPLAVGTVPHRADS
ncbi:MAG: anti-sigma factor [Acidimicrobiales bacterium]